MANEKNINSRIQHKHDIEANWLKATNFIPKEGELIIYDVDDSHSSPRFKVGDGANYINNLPFSSNAIIDVDELPAENIDPNVIYRTPGKAFVLHQGTKFWEKGEVNVHVVSALPANPILHIRDDETPLFRTWYYIPNENEVYCNWFGEIKTGAQFYNSTSFGGIVVLDSESALTSQALDKDKVYIIYIANDHMLHYYNTEKERWVYIPELSDTRQINNTNYEVAPIIKRNSEETLYRTLTTGGSADTVPLRTTGGALRAQTNFTGLNNDAEKNQVLINKGYLESNIITETFIKNLFHE